MYLYVLATMRSFVIACIVPNIIHTYMLVIIISFFFQLFIYLYSSDDQIIQRYVNKIILK